jgi:PAS domain S-box-containing protein
VFFGINNQERARSLNGTALFTGVIESVSMAETIDVIRQLRPGTRAVHAIVDSEPGGQGDLRTYLDLRKQFPNLRLDVLPLTDMTWDTLGSALRSLPREDAVLLLSAYHDRTGATKSFAESLALIIKESPAPTFHLWEHGMGQGIVGGKLISHREQGRIAAALASRIMNGTSPSTLPVVEGNAANKFIFDHAALERFLIDESSLPQGAEIRKSDQTLFEQYRLEILIVALFMLSLLVLVFALLTYVLRLRQTRQQLHEREEHYRALFDSSADGIVVADPQTGAFLHVNPAMCALFRTSERHMLTLKPTDIHPEDQRNRVLDEFQLMVSGRTNTTLTMPCLRSDGSIFLADIRSFFIQVQGKECIAALFRDVTDKKLADEKIHTLSLAVDQSPAGIVIADRQGRIEYVNRKFSETTGYSAGEVLGQHVQTLASDEIPPETIRDLWHSLRTGGDWRGEFRNKRKDGSVYWAFAAVSPMREPTGEITHYLAVQEDVTARKETEKALQQAKDAAEAASLAKNEFLANMSHEIRTPLNGIVGMLQVLELSDPTAAQLENIRHALDSSLRLTRLLSDILDLAKVEVGKLTLEEGPFSLAEVQDSILGLFSLTAGEKGVALEFTLDDRLPSTLVGDSSRLQQILFNLVGNALKFTDTGTVSVHASLLPTQRQGECMVLFCVQDTGIGIPDEKVVEIFNPFVQVDNTFTRRFQGAGLGLSIVRRIVALMRGTMSIDSSSQGTSICLSLPLHLPDGQDMAVQPSPEPLPESRLKILLAEDDTVNRVCLTQLLEKTGHTVVTAQHGLEVLELLAREDFDLVLMDVQMPIMGGLEATRRIRASSGLGATSRIPIVALTAHAMSGDREICLAAGMNGYVAKPVDIQSLNATLREVMADA